MSRKSAADLSPERATVSTTSGITTKATSASRQSVTSIMTMMATSVNTSPNTVTRPGGEDLVQRLDVRR